MNKKQIKAGYSLGTVYHYIYGLGGGGAERIIIQLLEQREFSGFENRLLLKHPETIDYAIDKISEVLIQNRFKRPPNKIFSIFTLLFILRRILPIWAHDHFKLLVVTLWLRQLMKRISSLSPELDFETIAKVKAKLRRLLLNEYNPIVNLANRMDIDRPAILSSVLLESGNATAFFTKSFFPKSFDQTKWVAAIHNNTSVRLSDIYDPETAKFWMNLTPIILADTNKVIAVSEGVKKDLVSSFGISSEKIQTILNPVDLVSIDQVKPAVVKKPFIISVGRLCSQKRFDILIDAFAACADQLPHELWLFGKGELEEDLKQKVAELGFQDRVQFMGFSSDVWSYMKTASCLVMTSQYEGLPMTLLEAKACGCPIVSYDCDYGPSELIKNDMDGFLVEYDNFYELTRRIIEICTDPKANSFSKNGLENVHQFSIEKVHANYEQLFESLLRKTFNTR